MRTFTIGGFGFLLQDYFVEELEENFMMNLHVDDVDTRFKHIQEANVTEKYSGTSLSLLKLEDWRVIVMHLIDPTGFL